jgi:hypothetical protein
MSGADDGKPGHEPSGVPSQPPGGSDAPATVDRLKAEIEELQLEIDALESENEDLREELDDAAAVELSPYDMPRQVRAVLDHELAGWPSTRWRELARLLIEEATP